MAGVMLKWSSLFNLPEVMFDGSFPQDMPVSDFIQMTLAWLTAADRTERKLIKCDAHGALLFSDPWNYFNPVEQGELSVSDSTEDTFTTTVPNQGILMATGASLAQFFIKRVSGGADEAIYVPAASFYWFPHPVYSVRARCVPYASGGASILGVTTYN